MPSGQVRVTCHEVDRPFYKRYNDNNVMQWSKWSTSLMIINLACMTLLDNENIVSENGRPKVTST